MPLVPNTLNAELVRAFAEAMDQFIQTTQGAKDEDVSARAIKAASTKFAEIATPAIDAYIKSASVQVTIPSGLVTQGASTASAPNLAPLPIFGIPGDLISTGGLT